MPKHTPGARIRRLVEDNNWKASEVEFIEFLLLVLPHIADPKVREAMIRFYGPDRGTQIVDPVTGKPQSADGRFYQHLEKGRAIVKTLLSFTPEEYDLLKIASSKVEFAHG